MPFYNKKKDLHMRFLVPAIIRRYCACDNGATLPLVGLVFLVLVAAVGLAVDYGRAQMVQSKMQASLDAAALAAATSPGDLGEKRKQANKYMEANFPVDREDGAPIGYMNTLYPEGSGQYITEFREAGNALILSAEGRVKTVIMQIFGFDTMDVYAHTEIAIQNVGLEVALVLDNTGSMLESIGSEMKITALRRASRQLIDDIYDKFDASKTFIGIVPFGYGVNVGAARETGSIWKRNAAGIPVNESVHCIYTDASNTVPSRDIGYAATDTPPDNSLTPTALFYNASGDVSCTSWMAEMTPMNANKQVLRNAIDAMIVKHDTTTRVDLGAVWGWRMLSPDWRGKWAHASWKGTKLPLDYNVEDMRKVAIILTDGDNWDGSGDPAIRKAVEKRADERLTEVCMAMKEAGVTVYTVTLLVETMADLMRGCATSEYHYFHVPPGGSLDNVFSQIAASLTDPRISR